MDWQTDIGKGLRELRERRRESLRKAAENMPFSWQSLQKYETGEIALKTEHLGDILDAYGATLGELAKIVQPGRARDDGRYRDLDGIGTSVIRERDVDAGADALAQNPEIMASLLETLRSQNELLEKLRKKLGDDA